MVNTVLDNKQFFHPCQENHTKPEKHLHLPPDLIADLQQVDDAMLECVKSHSVLITIAGHHVLRSGGKRLRAALTLLTAQLGSYSLDKVIHAATAVELIHVASLVHDDLVDEAERRRGVMAVHARWDHGVALMVGDYFFALASKEMALAPDPRIISYFAEAVMRICEGELAPVMNVAPLDTALKQYYNKIGCKTAALFTAACKAGMASGGGTQQQIDLLGEFGYDLGLAFQIVDDILDFTGNEDILGKPAGSDLRQGIITLPLIYAVEAGGGGKLLDCIDAEDEDQIEWAITEVKRLGGIDRACETASNIIDRALARLESFPDNPAMQTFHAIATFILEREK